MPNILTLYQEDLKYEPLPFTRNRYTKYIYKTYGGNYCVKKTIHGKPIHYGTYPSLEEARKTRDQLIKHDWDKSIVQDHLDKEALTKKYYHHIQTNSDSRYYRIINFQDKYCGQVKTIEEALYYRDLVYNLPINEVKRPKEYDLTTDNPYIDNVTVPLPERLILKHQPTKYGTGHITKKGEQSYHVHYGKKGDGVKSYVCACRTYEQAYYVRQEMNKVGWDMSKLDEILEAYPVWYTWLNNFWKFVTPAQGGNGWRVNLTPRNTGYDKPEYVYFKSVENALWERDLLVKYGFDEELVTELADDSQNPYYDMEIPPYPQRKVRRIKEREPRTDLFNQMFKLIQSDEDYSQEELCEMCGLTSANFRMILLKEFDTNWAEFKRICESGENPNDVLEQKPLIYNPDLTLHRDATNIAYYKRLASPYVVTHWWGDRNHYYGAYPTRELAEKIIKDLKKVKWDKKQLKRIQKKHGWQSMVGSKRWVYPQKYKKKDGTVKIVGYTVRHKNKDKKMVNYGYYKDKRVAELVRDLLILADWNKDFLQTIQDYSFYCIRELDRNWRCQLLW